jgi:chromosome partitioning protein
MKAIISVCNLKGGAGKSTVAVNLACAIAERRAVDCRLVDADRQGTALAWGAKGLLPVPVVRAPLQEAKPEERYPGMMWITQIKSIAEMCDVLVIDMPPGLEYALAAVCALSDVILVPVNPSGVDFHATARFIGLIQKSREARRSTRPDCIIVPNRIDGRTTYERDLSDYGQFGERVAEPIHMRTAFAKGFDTGQWIGSLEAGSVAHQEITRLVDLLAADYQAPGQPPGATSRTEGSGAPRIARPTGRRAGLTIPALHQDAKA